MILVCWLYCVALSLGKQGEQTEEVHLTLDVQWVLCYPKKAMAKVTAVQVLFEAECLGFLIELFLVDEVCG